MSARSARTLGTALLAAVPLLAAACGGRSDGGSAAVCPPGFTCVAGGSGGSVSGTNDASTSWSSPNAGEDAGTEDAGSSPTGLSYPDGSTLPASSTMTVLDYQVTDAKFSTALSSLVIVSAMPSAALHIYDPVTKADRAVALPELPVAVAVDATGLKAAVAFDAHVAWVDLTSATVTGTCPISSDAFDIALSKEGLAYVMPRTDQWVSLHVVDSTCNETLEGGEVYAASHIALHPSETALFTADQGLSPSSINRCDLTSMPVDCEDAVSVSDWGTYGYCGALWISADGQRIYSACGVTLLVPGDPATDLCTYGGTLDGVTFLQQMAEAPTASRIVLIPGDEYDYDPAGTISTTDTVVRVHETQYLGFVAQYELPPFPLAGTSTAISHGRFVFTTPTMNTIFAIVQADPSSGALNDYAVVTMVP